ncbi:YbaB/EbfC family nucleoid-associated protein [Kineosporia sp. J2-2]|uniref:YbaB/EbfC family nucleoid-associated protein n=1 Tax=Kineosporia corallincola TaxID=2835133 RepID=A0ABS5TP17_9ACTN|nr:YbaB/EbfC family nucleoid-associated protein [Kineosporia corallincola]MBT0772852.1 YbaB/EbfC family nucleoid-associated protein [Kineosporia corallincola]
MSSEYDEILGRAMAEYGRSRDRALKARRDIDALTETATAPRQVVQVTVDAMGRLTELKFPTASYKSMPAPELAKIILKTVSDARERVGARAASAMAPALPPHVDPAALLSGRMDGSALIPDELAEVRGSSDPWQTPEDHHE